MSSSSCEQVAEVDSSEEVEVAGTRAIVTTEYSKHGCPVLLEIEEEGQKIFLMPIELAEKFKVHGTKVLIEYRFSRIMQSECQKGRPVVVEKVRLTD